MKRTAEHNAKIAAAKRGYVTPQATKDKLSVAAMRQHEEGRVRYVKPNEASRCEQFLIDRLDALGVSYVWHARVGSYTVDFLIDDLVVEFHGCWWHRCKRCGFRDNGVRASDMRRRKFLESKGYAVDIIWEHELKEVMPRVR